MIITRAPLRISFAGGGTDISPFCDEYEGACLAVAIKKYAYAIYGGSAPLTPETNAVADYFEIPRGELKISFYPVSCSGLGGSAAGFVAAVATIASIYDRKELHAHAYNIERHDLGVLGGYQDQVVSCYGGCLFMRFYEKRRVECEKVKIPMPMNLEDFLYLVYAGNRRDEGTKVIEEQLKINNVIALKTSKKLAYDMRTELEKGNLIEFGMLLEEAWITKKQFTSLVTTPKIDNLHDMCLKNGAIAFKLCGAGSGGYAVVMADPKDPYQLPIFLRENNIYYEHVYFDLDGVRYG